MSGDKRAQYDVEKKDICLGRDTKKSLGGQIKTVGKVQKIYRKI